MASLSQSSPRFLTNTFLYWCSVRPYSSRRLKEIQINQIEPKLIGSRSTSLRLLKWATLIFLSFRRVPSALSIAADIYEYIESKENIDIRTILGILGSLKVDEATANTLASGVTHNLHGKNVAEIAEGIVERLVVNGLVQSLDKDISDTRALWKRAVVQLWLS